MRACLAVATILVATLLYGCGGTTKTVTVPATQRISKAEFIAQMDRLCARVRRGTNASGAKLKVFARRQAGLSSEEALRSLLAPVFRDLARLYETTVRKMEALPRPQGNAAPIERLLALYERGVGTLDDLATAAEDGNVADFRSIYGQLEKAGIGAEARGIAQTYGFKVCGHHKTS